MAAVGEDELICDFAETYHVLEWRELPLKTAAALACGLRPDSRIIQKLTGERVNMHTALIAAVLDRLKILVWQNTEDGRSGRNPPKSTYDALTGHGPRQPQVRGFRSPEAFEAARARIMEGGEA